MEWVSENWKQAKQTKRENKLTSELTYTIHFVRGLSLKYRWLIWIILWNVFGYITRIEAISHLPFYCYEQSFVAMLSGKNDFSQPLHQILLVFCAQDGEDQIKF